MNRKTPFVLFILALIAYFALTPFLEWTIQLNQEMALPSFLKGLESWMKTSEEQAKVITEVFVKMPTFGSFLFTVFYMALLPAIAEEFLFRGFLQRTIFNWTRKINLSIIISAFVFSFIHFQFYGFLPRMLLGMLLGYLFYWSGNLKLSVFIHFMNNFLSILVTYIQQNEKIDLDPDKMPANPWLIVFSIVSGAIMLYGIYKTGQRKNIEFANRNVADDDARNPELKWKKVYSTPKLYQAEIFLGKLRNEGLRAVLKNKKDSAYTVFGTVEIYVPEEEEAQANSIIESKE